MVSVGIIGFGSFGRFLCEKLMSHAELRVYDSLATVPVNLRADIEQVVASDYLILAVPLSVYEELFDVITPILPKTTVIVDVASVKVKPTELLRSRTTNTIVATHPLFGPQSASVSLESHTFVMCPDVSNGEEYQAIKEFATGLGLNVVEKTTEQHDKEMAYTQGLTFFVARALMSMDIHSVELQTPSYLKLLALAELEKHHSEGLFNTIQNGNPFAEQIRDEFKQQLEAITAQINQA